jgi:hypothetical protein
MGNDPRFTPTIDMSGLRAPEKEGLDQAPDKTAAAGRYSELNGHAERAAGRAAHEEQANNQFGHNAERVSQTNYSAKRAEPMRHKGPSPEELTVPSHRGQANWGDHGLGPGGGTFFANSQHTRGGRGAPAQEQAQEAVPEQAEQQQGNARDRLNAALDGPEQGAGDAASAKDRFHTAIDQGEVHSSERFREMDRGGFER